MSEVVVQTKSSHWLNCVRNMIWMVIQKMKLSKLFLLLSLQILIRKRKLFQLLSAYIIGYNCTRYLIDEKDYSPKDNRQRCERCKEHIDKKCDKNLKCIINSFLFMFLACTHGCVSSIKRVKWWLFYWINVPRHIRRYDKHQLKTTSIFYFYCSTKSDWRHQWIHVWFPWGRVYSFWNWFPRRG